MRHSPPASVSLRYLPLFVSLFSFLFSLVCLLIYLPTYLDLNSGGAFQRSLAHALLEGEGGATVAMARRAARRLFRVRLRLGLLDPPGSHRYDYIGAEVLNCREHKTVAREAAKRSIVLLRNDNGALPLSLSPRVRRLAVLGPAADDTFRMFGNYFGCADPSERRNSSGGGRPGRGRPTPANPLLPGACGSMSPLDAIKHVAKEKGVEVRFHRGVDQDSADGSGLAAARALASWSDAAVVLVGLRNCERYLGVDHTPGDNEHMCEGEGRDRGSLRLPGLQAALVRAVVEMKPNRTVAVVSGGGPVADDSLGTVPALALSFYGGAEGGRALASFLFGLDGSSPSARLPFTIPASDAQMAADTDFAMRRRQASSGSSSSSTSFSSSKESDLCDTSDVPSFKSPQTFAYRSIAGGLARNVPSFPFGFGIGYASFRYTRARRAATTGGSNASMRICVEVTREPATVLHVGKARDTVQIYVSFEDIVSTAAGRRGRGRGVGEGEDKQDCCTRKAAAQTPTLRLLAFSPTPELEPGESTDVCLSFPLTRLRVITASERSTGIGSLAPAPPPAAPLDDDDDDDDDDEKCDCKLRYEVLAGRYSFFVGGVSPQRGVDGGAGDTRGVDAPIRLDLRIM